MERDKLWSLSILINVHGSTQVKHYAGTAFACSEEEAIGIGTRSGKKREPNAFVSVSVEEISDEFIEKRYAYIKASEE